jgi:hypothetical protein
MKQYIVTTIAASITLVFFYALGAAKPAQAAADESSYPWCTQGSSLHCYYGNRQQCEETVDYHGFCVANPDYDQQQEKNAPRFERHRYE